MNFKIIATLVAALTLSTTAAMAGPLDDTVARFAEAHPEIGIMSYNGEATYLGIYLHLDIENFEVPPSEICAILVPGAKVEVYFWMAVGDRAREHQKGLEFVCP